MHIRTLSPPPTRRRFLRNSALVGGAFAVGPNLGALIPEDVEPLRFGVIGTGSRGSGLMRVLADLEGAEVVAGCDILPFRLQPALEHAPGAVGYDDYRRLLDDPKVEAVIVSTPLSMHHHMVVDALDAGKHIYCEKTMTYTTHDAVDLVGKVNGSGVVFQVGYQYRYHPVYQKVAEMVHLGELGDVTNVYMQWNRNGDWRRPVPDPQYERLINWRMYEEYSGGLLAELGSHHLDYINWVFGERPEKVIGFGGIDYWKDGRETCDNVNVVWSYPSGMKVNFVSLTANAFDGYKIEIRGSAGTVVLGVDHATFFPEASEPIGLGLVSVVRRADREPQWSEADGVSGATRTDGTGKPGRPVTYETAPGSEGWGGTQHALAAFIDSVRTGREVSSNVTRGAWSAISTRMAIDAVRGGGEQRWQEKWDGLTS